MSGFTIINNLDFSIEENELRVFARPERRRETTLDLHDHRPVQAGFGLDPLRRPRHHRLGARRHFSGRHQPEASMPNMYETLSVFDHVMVSLRGRRPCSPRCSSG